MINVDNLARTPDVQTLNERFLTEVVCSKSRGMVHITAHFLPLSGRKKEFWTLKRCNYPDELLNVCGDYQPLKNEVKKYSKSELSPDLYYNLTTFYGKSNKPHSFRGVWVDVDTKPHRSLDVEQAEMYASIFIGACEEYSIPAPWVVFTGRGLQLVWCFGDAVPYTEKYARWMEYTLKRLCEWFGELCQSMGLNLEADSNATNLTRLLRLPGTFNSLTMPPLRAQVLAVGVPCTWSAFSVLGASESATAPTERAQAIPVLPTPALTQTVIQSRLERLQAWAAGRDFDIEGNRNEYLHLCACLLRDSPSLEDDIDAINARLLAPLGVSELRRICKSAKTHCYKYSNAKIVEVLEMDASEAEAFGSACPSGYVLGGVRRTAYQLAQATGVDTRRPHRKRDAERAQRKAEKAEVYAQIPRLHSQGLSYADIAKKLGLSKPTVLKHQTGV